MEVAGDAGTLRVADPWHIHTPGIELRDARACGRSRSGGELLRLEAEDLAAVIDGSRGGGGGLGRDDAIGQARALGMLHRAAL